MSRANWTDVAWYDAHQELDGRIGVVRAPDPITYDLYTDVLLTEPAPCGEDVGECVCCEVHPQPCVVAFTGRDWGGDTDADYRADYEMDRAADDRMMGD